MRFNSKMLSAAAAAALIVTMAGCESTATSSSKTGGTAQHISNPKGSVTGTVQDTNGNPIKDVTVYLAGQSTTTDAGGVYSFSSVPVTQVFDIGVTANEVGEKLSVTIAAPEGYIGATVTVRPAAQITNDANTTNGVKTFIDGFVASAGVAVLPQKGSEIRGVLRNNITGETVANQVINLDLTSVNAVNQQQKQDLVNTSYAVDTYTVVTDANGSFSLTDLPMDARFNTIVPGYTVISNGVMNTSAEPLTVIGNVKVTEITALDTVAPFINVQSDSATTPYIGVTHPTDAGETMVVFKSGIDGSAGHEFVINLTEPVQGIKDDTVSIYDRTHTQQLTATTTLENNGMSLKIATDTNVTEGTILEFRIRRADLIDMAGNVSHTDTAGAFDASGGGSNATTEIQSALGSQFIVLNASTSGIVKNDLPLVVAAQNSGTNPDLLDNGYVNPALNTVSDYTYGTSTVISQMNAKDANTADLLLLAKTLDTTITALSTKRATITFTADPKVVSYWARVVDKDGNDITATIKQVINSDKAVGGDAITPNTPTTPNNTDLQGGGTNIQELVDGTTVVETFLVELGQPLEEGDHVELYSLNSFGDTSVAVNVALKDNTPLTTVINNNDATFSPIGANTVDIVGAGAPVGATGNLLDQSVTELGAGHPYLYVRADMLQGEYSELDNSIVPPAVNDLKKELTGSADDIYDAADFAAMDKSRSIGVQISEPIDPTANIVDTVKVLDTSAAEVTGVVTAASGGIYYTKNVVAIKVNDIFNMQDYGYISLKNTPDAYGNLANKQAADKLYDAMPPMMTSAVVNATSVSFTFTEDISLIQTNAAITGLLKLGGGTANYSFDTDTTGKLTVTRTQTYTDYKGETLPAGTALEVVATNVSGVLNIQLTGKLADGSVPPFTNSEIDFNNYFAEVHGIKNLAGTDNAVATGSSIVDFTNVPDTMTNAAGVDGTYNSWANAADHMTVVPKFAVSDKVAPKLATYTLPLNLGVAPASQISVHAISNVAIGGESRYNINANDADALWEVGDTTAVGNEFTIQLKFREPIAKTANVSDLFALPVFSYTVATPNNTYKHDAATDIAVTAVDTIEFTFSKESETGNVQAGDAITITGIKDSSGNTTDVTVTLNTAGQGVTLSTSSYK